MHIIHDTPSLCTEANTLWLVDANNEKVKYYLLVEVVVVHWCYNESDIVGAYTFISSLISAMQYL